MNIYSKIIEHYPELKNKELDTLFSFIKYNSVKKVGLKKQERHREIIIDGEKLIINIDYNNDKYHDKKYLFNIVILCYGKKLHSFKIECEYVGYDIGAVEEILKYTIYNNKDKVDFLLENIDRLTEYCIELDNRKSEDNKLQIDYTLIAETKYKDLIDKKVIEYYEFCGSKYYRINHNIYYFYEMDLNQVINKSISYNQIMEQKSIIYSAENRIKTLLTINFM